MIPHASDHVLVRRQILAQVAFFHVSTYQNLLCTWTNTIWETDRISSLSLVHEFWYLPDYHFKCFDLLATCHLVRDSLFTYHKKLTKFFKFIKKNNKNWSLGWERNLEPTRKDLPWRSAASCWWPCSYHYCLRSSISPEAFFSVKILTLFESFKFQVSFS